MKISELVATLNQAMAQSGDIDVFHSDMEPGIYVEVVSPHQVEDASAYPHGSILIGE